jgi:hypothetical protein
MSDLSIPISGLQTSIAQSTASAANIVTAQSGDEPAPAGYSSYPIGIKSSDFTSDLVTQTLALANYRATLAVISAQNAMDKSTLDLIG